MGGRQVIVLGGDLPGLALAETARRQGSSVTVLEATPVFGLHLGLPGRWRRVHDLRALGIALEGGAQLVAIDADCVTWRRGDEVIRTPADVVYAVSRMSAETALADELAASGADVRAIGDCHTPGLLEGAMQSALESRVAL